MTSTLGVLCLNGRRQTVKTAPSTTILQVLQEVCRKQGFDDAEIDLVHQRKVLDVTKTIRHANIPNNGKLEMVKRNVPRKASNINIAIQTDYGERILHQFHPSTTLFDVLKQLEGDPGSLHHGKLLCRVPVIIYMSHKISGIKCLQETTLKNFGLIGGNAVLRLLHEEEKDTVHGNDTSQDANVFSSTAAHDQSKPASSVSSDISKAVVESSSNHEAYDSHDDKRERDLNEDSVEPVVKRLKSDSDSESAVSIEPKFTQDAITDRNIMRGSAVAHQFSQFKFPETQTQPIDENTIEAIDPKKIMAEERLEMACNRRTCVFNFNNIDSKVKYTEDPDDSFYEPTIDDLRLRIYALRSLATEDAPLTTKNMRAAKNMEKAFKYKQIVLRIQFPGRFVLQGIFRPLEKVKAVKDFVKEHLQNKEEKFYLYTTPPKCVLKDLEQTLHNAKLIPTALIHFSCDNSIDNLLKKELLDSSITFEEADKIAFDVLKRCSSQTTSSTLSTNEGDAHVIPETDVTACSPPNDPLESKTSKSTGSKAPKWFKAGKR